MNKDKILIDAVNLSSGTMATLTGLRSYGLMDQIQAEFVAFVAKRPFEFETWMIAWEAYKAVHPLPDCTEGIC